MKLKLTILTILVALLTGLSMYGVYGGQDQRPVDFAFTKSSDRSGLDSQTAYILSAAEPNNFPVRNPDFPDPQISAKAFLLYEVKSGKTVLSKNSKQPLPVASLTKLLTALIVSEHLPSEEIVVIDAESHNVDQEGADFHLGERLYVKDMLGAMLVQSSNDAAVALAKAVEAKTGGRFPEMMNRKAYEIGLINSSFLDPAGLNDGGYSTAEDLLKLVQYSKRYQEVWGLLGLKSWEVRSTGGQRAHSFFSTNKLWETLPDILGGKTGYTEGALGCMILEVKGKDGQGSFLTILLGSAARFEDTKKLIEWGQAAFRWE